MKNNDQVIVLDMPQQQNCDGIRTPVIWLYELKWKLEQNIL